MSNDVVNLILIVAIVIGWLVLLVWLYYEWSISRRRSFKERIDELPVVKPSQLPAQPINTKGVVLALEVSRDNEKTPLAAEVLFSSLHGIKTTPGIENISLEIDAREKSIRFYVWVPEHLRGYVEGQIYAQYPGINIKEAPYDYFLPLEADQSVAVVELGLEKDDIIPIKTFQNFEVDPLSAITAAISQLGADERITIQVAIAPEDNSWRTRALKYIEKIKSGIATGTILKRIGKEVGSVLVGTVKSVLLGGTSESKPSESKPLSPGLDATLQAVEEKSTKLGFRTGIRILSIGKDTAKINSKLQLVVAAFKQFNSNSLNGFRSIELEADRSIYEISQSRHFPKNSFILNVTELASIYHLPNQTVVTPNISWAGSKKGEAPATLPLASENDQSEITLLAQTNFRGNAEKFGIKLSDRRRHIYVVGKSGVGKSTLLENMSISDITHGRGIGVIDPHGEYIDNILKYIPEDRIDDVVLFDVSDQAFPIAFNVLEVRDPSHKSSVASGVVSVFKKIFGDSWGPRLEYWLRNSILALLDYPEATLMMVPKLLTSKPFRTKVVSMIQDVVLKNAWENEFERMADKLQNEAVGPILNKVGQFLSMPVIRNIVGQPRSTVSMRQIMDEGKILLVKLPKGLIGEDNATLLGAFIVTQLQLAALSRADIPEKERRDFYLYVDEFQNFATESFGTILSEARKYHLSLTIANQYMAQLLPQIKDAVFGNVGTLIAFRVGADDASQLAREFAPVFSPEDMVGLSIYNIYVKLSIDGLTTNAFSAITLPPLKVVGTDSEQKIIQLSRERFAHPREEVSRQIDELSVSMSEGESADNRPSGGNGYRRPPFKPMGAGVRPMTPNRPPLADIVKNIEKQQKTSFFDENKDKLHEALLEEGGSSSFSDALKKATTANSNLDSNDQSKGSQPTDQTPR